MKLRAQLMTAAALSGGGLAYFKLARPRVLNYGATREEIQRAMPGDGVLMNATLQTTRAVTIAAGPEHVWPWLVQMGPKPRAGAYTFDLIERMLGIDIENSDRILPECQHLEAGEVMALNDKGAGIKVLEVQPERTLVLQWMPKKSTWVFALYPNADGTCRLVSRNRLPGTGPLFWLSMVAFMEPGSLIMEAKMLSGIKRRAEKLARSEETSAHVVASTV